MRRRSLAALLIAVLGVIGMPGIAWAWFSSTGTGTASGTVGSAQQVTVVAASGSPSTQLVPGGTGDLVMTLDNPNSYTVNITGITQNGPVVVSGGSGCTNSGVTVPTQSGLSIPVASGTGVTIHIPNGAAMANSSDSGCQGAQFQVPVTVTGQQG
jgi:hypothetical protein